ncbi:MAG: NTP transferase domain-containing protein [Acidobacteriota bacterium]|nr:NTP transferase domain-containing protein [Acidobacteriota bacterium]
MSVTKPQRAPQPTTHAIVLAAGNGDRFRNGSGKLLHPFLGRPLLLCTIEAAHDAGIQQITIVLGHDAERVRALVNEGAPSGVAISYVFNPEWQLENGVSVLAARAMVNGGHVALLMGDHVFQPDVLRGLRQLPLAADESVLAIDTHTTDPMLVAEATKVLRDGSRIISIGKEIEDYDALDTGMFVCAPNLFEALETARAAGDTTLSGGIRVLAARGLMRGHDIGDAGWRDIDTVDDLQEAESAMSILSS